MRAIWRGAVAFGLVNVPVKLYAATGEHSVTLNQVHVEDGGRIRYRKVCSVDGEEVPFDQIAKGYQTDDGRMVVLTDEDFEQLPLATEREIAVEEFVPVDQVDPIMLGKTYYLEPDKTAAKPYALLREALKTTDRMAVVKVALRQRESMAVLRVRDDVICLQTLLWPDEIRAADFPILEADVQVRPQELQMAASLVESLAGDFDPSAFEDSYQSALEALIEAKVSSGGTVAPQAAAEEAADDGGDVVDLLSALQRSVERARSKRAGGAEAPAAAAAAEPAAPAEDAADDEEEAAAPPKRASRARAASGTSGAKASGTTSSRAKGTKAGTAKADAADDDAPAAKKPRATKAKAADAETKPATRRRAS